jgi:hypothetical protein
VPVKAHNSVEIVERYYGPLYYIYHIIIAELLDINKDIALQMAFKAINDFTGPNSLIPTLLVFKAYLYIIKSDIPNPIVIKRAAALKKAIKEVKKLKTEHQMADTLNIYNRPKITAIYNLPLNSPILVWREGPIGQSSY